MKTHFYKYQGTGNDFIMIDNRSQSFPKSNVELIHKLCDRKFGVGADGLILLEDSENYDFKMVYFNADGNEGSMCGNGGRCLVAFANQLKVIKNKTTFDAVDGLHHATFDNGIVSLQMIDVENIENFENHSFLNTGSPHHVEFVSHVSKIDVQNIGEKIRYGAPYFEEGTNVNFTEIVNDSTINVRTYERGVEDETLSCGTGVTAAAIAAFSTNKVKSNSIDIIVPGGKLNVSFKEEHLIFNNIFLTGAATFVFEGVLEI